MSEYTTAFTYINTKLNVGSDALSRNARSEFMAHVTRVYDVDCFVELQVPGKVRDIDRVVREFRRHPEWIVMDGERAQDRQTTHDRGEVPEEVRESRDL